MYTRAANILFASVLIIAAACNGKPGNSSRPGNTSNNFTTEEKFICDSFGFDPSVIIYIQENSKGKIEKFHYSLGKIITKGEELESDPILLKGLVFTEANNKSYDVVFSLKDKFRAKGYSIFLLENNYNIDNKPDHIAVLKTTDQFTVLKQVATDGINWDITNDSLITIIRKLDKKYSLELIAASGDWCEFIIHHEPDNWLAFAKEIYAICPDVVDQGTDTVEALAEEMKKTKRLYLWWD